MTVQETEQRPKNKEAEIFNNRPLVDLKPLGNKNIAELLNKSTEEILRPQTRLNYKVHTRKGFNDLDEIFLEIGDSLFYCGLQHTNIQCLVLPWTGQIKMGISNSPLIIQSKTNLYDALQVRAGYVLSLGKNAYGKERYPYGKACEVGHLVEYHRSVSQIREAKCVYYEDPNLSTLILNTVNENEIIHNWGTHVDPTTIDTGVHVGG